MPTLFKIFVILLTTTYFAEGKIKANERILPIEVVLNSKSDGKVPIPESSLVKNKAIELKIRSDEGKGGKVDLVIAATKEVQATERNVDRYSPAFNAEHDLLNNETPRNYKPMAESNGNWDTSRQDSHFLHPSQSTEMFPFLLLRHVLQSPQPLMLEQNQFSPLQNLRHFEDNLQKELMPHINQGINPGNDIPAGVVVSQPIFTGSISPDILNQQRLLNSPQILNMMQHGLIQPIQQNNQNIPLNIPQQMPRVQNTPLNRYPLVNGAPLTFQHHQGQNLLQNNDISNNLQRPIQLYTGHQNIQPPLRQQPLVSQSLPNILAPNRQPLPIHNRPEYTLERNLQNINTPLHRNIHQNSLLPQQRDIRQNLPQLLDNGIRSYQQNRDPKHVLPYQPINDKPHQHLFTPLQQSPLPEHHSLHPIQQTVKDSMPIDLHHLQRLQNIPNANNNQLHTYQERYRHPIREYNSHTLNQPNFHNLVHQQGLPQQSLSNDFNNPSFRNDPLSNVPEDHRKIPVHHPPNDARPSHIQNLPRSPGAVYPLRESISSGHQLTQNHVAPIQQGYSNRQVYQEPSYRSQPQNTPHGASDSNSHSSESHQADPERLNKYKGSYDSSTPTKRRKLRHRKKPVTDKIDLDGQSSHQYIIKIG